MSDINNNENDGLEEREDREERRKRRREERRRIRRRNRKIKIILTRWVPFACVCILLIFLLVKGISAAAGLIFKSGDKEAAATEEISTDEAASVSLDSLSADEAVSEDEVPVEEPKEIPILNAEADERTGAVPGEVVSEHAVLVALSENRIVAGRDYSSTINPASMTKVLTILVAAETMEERGDSVDDKFEITQEIENYSYVHECSNVGFSVSENVTMNDLFYGAILPSGGDAAYALAIYAGGSMEGFADMMNAKMAELGCSDSAHFTNSIGLYDENHHCTTYDMARIMYAAMQNDYCKEVLSAHKYVTSSTPEHPEGIELSNWFLRRIEDKDSGGTVVAAKTGFVVQSKNCAVSYAEDSYGNGYICATGGSSSAWRCIYDHVAIYKKYLP
ncbi:MAG: D-alanyl-D-alanine carboxypeptidase [Lachnospiraceae bacterium]|nr:D-alanyl-D-alanine carboxypeptidase [Lachnospiraceae bacterium]